MNKTHIICDHCNIEAFIITQDEINQPVLYCPHCGQPLEKSTEYELPLESDESEEE